MNSRITLGKGFQIIKFQLFKYSRILFFYNCAAILLNTVFSLDTIITNPPLLIPYLVLVTLLAIVYNTIDILFIKAVRKEAFHKEDITYSFRKVFIHFVTRVIFVILDFGLLYVALRVVLVVPFLAIPVVILRHAFESAVSAFIAFAIYDDTKNAVMMVMDAVRMLIKHLWSSIKMVLPLSIWTLLFQSAYLRQINELRFYGIHSLSDMADFFGMAQVGNFIFSYIILMMIDALISGLIQCPMFSAYALIYESERKQSDIVSDSSMQITEMNATDDITIHVSETKPSEMDVCE